MQFSEAVKLALQSLWSNKLRSILTLLGMVIAIASVMLVVSLTNGAKEFVTTKINTYGAATLTISKMPQTFMTIEEYLEFQKRKSLRRKHQGGKAVRSQTAGFQKGSGNPPAQTAGTEFQGPLFPRQGTLGGTKLNAFHTQPAGPGRNFGGIGHAAAMPAPFFHQNGGTASQQDGVRLAGQQVAAEALARPARFAVQREARKVHSLRSGVQFQAHGVVAQLVTRLSGSREQGGCGGTQKHAAGKRRKGGEFRVSHILT